MQSASALGEPASLGRPVFPVFGETSTAMDHESELWRGVVHTSAGKFLGEKIIRANGEEDARQRLMAWLDRVLPPGCDDIALTACRLVTKGPEVLLAARPLEPEPLEQPVRLWPVEAPPEPRETRAVPVEQRYR